MPAIVWTWQLGNTCESAIVRCLVMLPMKFDRPTVNRATPSLLVLVIRCSRVALTQLCSARLNSLQLKWLRLVVTGARAAKTYCCCICLMLKVTLVGLIGLGVCGQWCSRLSVSSVVRFLPRRQARTLKLTVRRTCSLLTLSMTLRPSWQVELLLQRWLATV